MDKFLIGNAANANDLPDPRPAGSSIRPETTAREPDLSGQRAGNPGGHPPLEYVQGNGAAQ